MNLVVHSCLALFGRWLLSLACTWNLSREFFQIITSGDQIVTMEGNRANEQRHWKAAEATNGDIYYYNTVIDETSWVAPQRFQAQTAVTVSSGSLATLLVAKEAAASWLLCPSSSREIIFKDYVVRSVSQLLPWSASDRQRNGPRYLNGSDSLQEYSDVLTTT